MRVFKIIRSADAALPVGATVRELSVVKELNTKEVKMFLFEKDDDPWVRTLPAVMVEKTVGSVPGWLNAFDANPMKWKGWVVSTFCVRLFHGLVGANLDSVEQNYLAAIIREIQQHESAGVWLQILWRDAKPAASFIEEAGARWAQLQTEVRGEKKYHMDIRGHIRVEKESTGGYITTDTNILSSQSMRQSHSSLVTVEIRGVYLSPEPLRIESLERNVKFKVDALITDYENPWTSKVTERMVKREMLDAQKELHLYLRGIGKEWGKGRHLVRAFFLSEDEFHSWVRLPDLATAGLVKVDHRDWSKL